MPRPKAQGSLAKNQLELAIALSSSLHESKTRELSRQAEELPADAIEDGAVPQEIQRMQKEFLEKLKGKPTAPARRTRKVASTVVPTLLTRTSDERTRIVTEKVALVIIRDDDDDEEDSASDEPQPQVNQNQSNQVKSKLRSNAMNVSAAERSEEEEEQQRSFPDCFITTQFTRDNHTHHQFQNDWQDMVNNPRLSDVTIITKSNTIAAHKLVFCVRCPAILEEVINGNLIRWNKIPHHHALAFLEFLYCGRVNRTRALGDCTFGVIFLARKYRILDLLKLIVEYESDDSTIDNPSIRGDSDELTGSPMDDIQLKGNTSLDMFAEVDESATTSAGRADRCKSTLADSHESITIDSDEDMGLLNDFFGTKNPVMLSPPLLSSSLPSTFTRSVLSSSAHNISSKDLESHFNQSGNSELHSTDSLKNETVNEVGSMNRDNDYSRLPGGSENKPEDAMQETFLNPIEISSSEEDDKSEDLESTDTDTDDSDVATPVALKRKSEGGENFEMIPATKKACYDLTDEVLPRGLLEFDPIEVSSGENSPRYIPTCTNADRFATSASRELFPDYEDLDKTCLQLPDEVVAADQMHEKCVTSRQEEAFVTPKAPRVASLIKQNNNSDKQLLDDSFVCDLSESYLLRGKQQVETPKQLPCGSYLLRGKQQVETPKQLPSESYLLCGEQQVETPKQLPCGSYLLRGEQQVETPKQLPSESYLLRGEQQVETPKQLPCGSYLLRGKQQVETPKQLPSESYLLRGEQQVETPEQPEMIFDTPIRTPFDNIKTSSPVTPMPDYNTMSEQEFEDELERYGLKRNLSRNKGTQLLKYIYGQLHPLAEVVNLRGKKLFIPIGFSSSQPLTEPVVGSPLAPVASVAPQSSETGTSEPLPPYTGTSSPGTQLQEDDVAHLSQMSDGSSDEECIIFEESLFIDIIDEEEDSPQASSSLGVSCSLRK